MKESKYLNLGGFQIEENYAKKVSKKDFDKTFEQFCPKSWLDEKWRVILEFREGSKKEGKEEGA